MSQELAKHVFYGAKESLISSLGRWETSRRASRYVKKNQLASNSTDAVGVESLGSRYVLRE